MDSPGWVVTLWGYSCQEDFEEGCFLLSQVKLGIRGDQDRIWVKMGFGSVPLSEPCCSSLLKRKDTHPEPGFDWDSKAWVRNTVWIAILGFLSFLFHFNTQRRNKGKWVLFIGEPSVFSVWEETTPMEIFLWELPGGLHVASGWMELRIGEAQLSCLVWWAVMVTLQPPWPQPGVRPWFRVHFCSPLNDRVTSPVNGDLDFSVPKLSVLGTWIVLPALCGIWKGVKTKSKTNEFDSNFSVSMRKDKVQ